MRTTSAEWIPMPRGSDGLPGGQTIVQLPPNVSIFNPEYSDRGLKFSWGPDWFNNAPHVRHQLSIFRSNRKRKYGKCVGDFKYHDLKFFLYQKELTD